MTRRFVLLLLAWVVAACADRTLTTGPALDGARFEIADAARQYKAGFYWLAPMVASPTYSGTFDPALSPTVEICELVNGACAATIASFGMTSGTGDALIQMHADEEHYHVNWHTDRFALDASSIYRVTVRAGIQHVVLGFADVQLVNNGSALRRIDTDEYIGLVDGRTLPIKFRIETGIVGAIEVRPSMLELEPGATQQFTATVYDLHGSEMTAVVMWASSNTAVATVDRTGLATALADGETMISASAERISGSATLAVVTPPIALPELPLLTAGSNHTCALARDRRASCWGDGDLGQLGDGAALDRWTRVLVAGGLSFVAMEGGQSHTCAINDLLEAYCWGSNAAGQLGNGGTGDLVCAGGLPCRSAPGAVAGGRTFSMISAGARSTCALTARGEAYCWGDGAAGALGTGGTTSSAVPVAVEGGIRFTSISVGLDFACGVSRSGAGYCWGINGSGQLGNGSMTTSLVPTPVSGGLTFATIVASQLHACGLTTSGAAYCWGSGASGRLGNGSNANRYVPTAVSGGLTVASITLGFDHTCAVSTGGQAYCWGANGSGRLGDGTLNTRTLPTLVVGGLTFASISAGQSHTCGLATDERMYCWGLNVQGQLGNGTTSTRVTPTEVAPLP